MQVSWGAVGIRASRDISRNGVKASVLTLDVLKAGVQGSDMLGRARQAGRQRPAYGAYVLERTAEQKAGD